MTKEIKKPRLSSIIVDGGKYMTTLTKKYKNKKPYKEKNPKLIPAFIPGTIVEISAKEGKKVEEGEVLMVLEAMKMRNDVVAPFSGRVKKITVSVGQMVPNRFVMVEME